MRLVVSSEDSIVVQEPISAIILNRITYAWQTHKMFLQAV